jgi:hypothetical protein
MSEDKAKAAKLRNTREVEQLLRQFSRTDGPKGNSSEFQRSWCRTFGRATGQHSGEVAPYTPAHHGQRPWGAATVETPGFDSTCSLCQRFIADGLLTPEGKPARCDDHTCWCHRPEDVRPDVDRKDES